MNRHVNAISGRLSLRPPQRRSLEILDRITEIAPPGKGPTRPRCWRPSKASFPR
jgi:type III restriction enzyme